MLAQAALRRPANWIQLLKFCVVGATGYAVNLGVYAALVDGAGLHYLGAAVCSFVVAVTNNYTWNRLWTFRESAATSPCRGRSSSSSRSPRSAANLAAARPARRRRDAQDPGAGHRRSCSSRRSRFLGNKLWSFR